MYVIKRNGNKAAINIEKIRSKIAFFNNYPSPLPRTNVELLTDEIVSDLHNNIKTSEIDDYTAKRAVDMSLVDPQYRVLGSRIAINNLHKATKNSFKDKMKMLYDRRDSQGNECPLVERTFYKFICHHQDRLDRMIDYKRDYLIDYAGLLTLLKSYLLKLEGQVVERPQDMYMRIAIALCMDTQDFNNAKALENISLTYDLLSLQAYSHASPTMFNAGTNHGQLSSCFLLGSGDSRHEIQRTLNSISAISKRGGGIGVDISSWRSAGSLIRGTNGLSKGNGNFLRLYDAGGNAYDQGGNRKGSIAVFLEVHHPDVITYIDLKKPMGAPDQRAPGLFYGLLVSDLFMTRVQEDGDWYLLDPTDCPGLNEAYGDNYEEMYNRYVKEGKYRKKMKARELWQPILENLILTGVPYLIAKDSVNWRNNLSHYSIIRTSNLCTEILLPATPEEYGVCTLAALVLSTFVRDGDTSEEKDLSYYRTARYEPYKRPEKPFFDFRALAKVVRTVVFNLDHVIDINKYPVDQAGISNFLHRPLGIGVSGLADAYCMMGYPFDSEEAADLNRKIFETISYASYSASIDLARNRRDNVMPDMRAFFSEWEEFKGREGMIEKLKDLTLRNNSYEKDAQTLETKLKEMPFYFTPRVKALECPAFPSYYWQQGLAESFQWNKWGEVKHSGMWDWDTLMEKQKKFGRRNSMLTAVMPTASTAHIIGVNECIEPFTSNVYRRKLLAGDILIINKYLIEDMIQAGIWSKEMANYLTITEGSVRDVVDCPQHLKDLYKTVWEIKQKTLIDQARDRAPYIDHTQSMNLFLEGASIEKVNSMLLYSWKKELKTLIYYLRTKPAAQPIKFSLSLDSHKIILEREAQKKRDFDSSKVVSENQECLGCSV